MSSPARSLYLVVVAPQSPAALKCAPSASVCTRYATPQSQEVTKAWATPPLRQAGKEGGVIHDVVSADRGQPDHRPGQRTVREVRRSPPGSDIDTLACRDQAYPAAEREQIGAFDRCSGGASGRVIAGQRFERAYRDESPISTAAVVNRTPWRASCPSTSVMR